MKVWAIIFGLMGFAGAIGSIVNGNLFYMSICAIVLAISIAQAPDKELEE